MRGKRAVLAAVFFLLAAGALAGCQDEKALENQKAYRKVGINKMESGDYKGAADAFQKALDQSLATVGAMEIDTCYYKAAAQYKSGDVAGALETYGALVDYDKKNADAYFLRGSIYLKEGDSKKAFEDYEEAFAYGGDAYGLYAAVYENLRNAGYTEEAQQVLDASLKIKGDDPEDRRERGYIYFLTGDYENARAELDQAINQGDAQAILYLAQVYDAQGETEQAQSLYESYLAKNGPDAETLNALGEKQMEDGNYSQALKFFGQALESEEVENEQRIRRNEIIACERLFDFAGAKEKMASYVEDYPQDEEAQREYIFLQTR